MTDTEGWWHVVTAFPESETTVAYHSEFDGWWFPDARFNEASIVGALLKRLVPEDESGHVSIPLKMIDEAIDVEQKKPLTDYSSGFCDGLMRARSYLNFGEDE